MPTEKENNDVELLSAMMGGDVDSTVALRVLRKFKGDMEKAADAMLAGDRGLQESTSVPKVTTTTPAQNVIDLTRDDNDEEMSRALQMSMETDPQPTLSSSEVTFGPSNREPDPNWAVVSTGAQQQISNEDESLKQAIEASLAVPEDNEENVELSDMLRVDGRPVALRADSASLAYAALVVHALFHVPQIRERMSRIQTQEGDPLSKLVEFLTNVDLANISTLVIEDSLLLSLGAVQSQVTIAPGVWSSDFVRRISSALDDVVDVEEERLTSFLTGRIRIIDGQPFPESEITLVHSIPVEVDADTSAANELVARLSSNLNSYELDSSTHDGITVPSQVLIFTLNKSGSATPSSATDTFAYPKTLYMDQFLLENLELANTKRLREREICDRLSQLEKQKVELTKHDNKDVMKNLKTSVHYFENVASVGNDPDRQASLAATAQKLRKVLHGLETAVDKINSEGEKLMDEMKSLFECPELQKHRYDLRAVLMHTGVPGRKQMYSYVQDRNGTWWKTLDYTVSEVTEADVLTDPTGLHLGAGPYMLIYSRYVPQEGLLKPTQWPRQYVDAVTSNNEHLLRTLSPDKREAKSNSQAERPAGKKRVTLAQGSQDVSMMDLTLG
ncbi:hypothetical protein AAF712_001846 [Marasmius tenuissimus]|uniref:USP domain-containing protein n=1 Tax=Marasmius tenuissimus TaxID=585030 RepID=A0ABR3ABD2_9AGAR